MDTTEYAGTRNCVGGSLKGGVAGFNVVNYCLWNVDGRIWKCVLSSKSFQINLKELSPFNRGTAIPSIAMRVGSRHGQR